MMRFLTTVSAIATSSVAHAGGFVVPIIDSFPSVVAAPSAAPSPWLALIPVALLLLLTRDGGDGRATLPPGDHGGPCFREGTLIGTQAGWVAVQDLQVGDMVATTKGRQPILHIGSWVPTEYRDIPAVVDGVYLTKNHHVFHGGKAIEAGELTETRGIIDGSRYYHILVEHHAWLFATGNDAGGIMAETMMLTRHIKPLCDQFPEVVINHAMFPADDSML